MRQKNLKRLEIATQKQRELSVREKEKTNYLVNRDHQRSALIEDFYQAF